MKKHIDEEAKIVYFQGDWPSVMGIPHIMKNYPEYTHCVLSWSDYEERYGKNRTI